MLLHCSTIDTDLVYYDSSWHCDSFVFQLISYLRTIGLICWMPLCNCDARLQCLPSSDDDEWSDPRLCCTLTVQRSPCRQFMANHWHWLVGTATPVEMELWAGVAVDATTLHSCSYATAVWAVCGGCWCYHMLQDECVCRVGHKCLGRDECASVTLVWSTISQWCGVITHGFQLPPAGCEGQ